MFPLGKYNNIISSRSETVISFDLTTLGIDGFISSILSSSNRNISLKSTIIQPKKDGGARLIYR